jgi:hypothetical protein
LDVNDEFGAPSASKPGKRALSTNWGSCGVVIGNVAKRKDLFGVTKLAILTII